MRAFVVSCQRGRGRETTPFKPEASGIMKVHCDIRFTNSTQGAYLSGQQLTGHVQIKLTEAKKFNGTIRYGGEGEGPSLSKGDPRVRRVAFLLFYARFPFFVDGVMKCVCVCVMSLLL